MSFNKISVKKKNPKIIELITKFIYCKLIWVAKNASADLNSY